MHGTQQLQQLRDAFGSKLLEQEPMQRHTNFRVGGPAACYMEARTAEDITRAVTIAREAGVPWFVLGGGSNTLVGDAGFDGLVIQIALRDIVVDGDRIRAGAGAITASVALEAGRAGLSGFEWAISLPGTIGGAARGNAGCFGSEMKDVIERVRVLDTGSSPPQTRDMEAAACDFHYRRSIFKEQPEWIILDVTLELHRADSVLCRVAMDQFLERRRRTQPHDKPSAGCLFKNVELYALSADAMDHLERFSAGTWRGVVHDGQLPVGWIIDQLGMKGHRVGNAQISEKHGNFTLNLGGATAADVLALGEQVRTSARNALGIDIEYEVQRLGC
ncbi:MAG: UDP-N-acetylmuramate dehydrogenase [bacterium]|nr:UDP-N-acetylmuramate dehydrogenase [bacterium]